VIVSTHAGHELLDPADPRLSSRTAPRLARRPALERASRLALIAAGHGARGRVMRVVNRKELADAVGNRWLIGYAVLLAVLGLAATATGPRQHVGPRPAGVRPHDRDADEHVPAAGAARRGADGRGVDRRRARARHARITCSRSRSHGARCCSQARGVCWRR
jgi:hypothetical protein